MTQPARSTLEVRPDVAALADAAAERFVASARRAIESHARFVVALSGGSTPRHAYERLSRDPFVSQVDWSSVHFLWGDERCVPPDHADSNYRMAREALLDHLPVPDSNVHRIHGEDDPAVAASSYETMLRELLHTREGPPSLAPGRRIDLVLLGLGDNGHTASIFPKSAALEEQTRWVIAEYVASVAMWRITLTAPILNAAAELLFLVSGGEKASVLRRVREGPHRPSELPAQVIAPSHGQLHWLVDATAAGELEGGS
jgi:6-phosphogluconolactonase